MMLRVYELIEINCSKKNEENETFEKGEIRKDLSFINLYINKNKNPLETGDFSGEIIAFARDT